MSQDIRAYRGTKIFKYLDPVSLETIQEKLIGYGHISRREPDREYRGEKTDVESPIVGEPELIHDLGLFGTIIFHKQEKEKNSDEIFLKKIPCDFIFFQNPSVLVIHGSRGIMEHVVRGLERAIHYDNNVNEPRKSDSGDYPDPFFEPIGFHGVDGKAL